MASVADALGLPGITIETALLAGDKLAMKKLFVEKGISIPWFRRVDSVAHLRRILSERGFPVVLKPVDSRGARGVLRLTESVDLDWAYEHSVSFSPSGRVMVEEYLEGPQISTESAIINGQAFTPGFTDRNAEQAALAMGITTGIAKGDMVLTKNGPKVIEIAARLSGGWFSTDQIPLATGVDLIGAAIKIALGEYVPEEDLIPRYQKGVAIRYFFPKPGRVNKIGNADSGTIDKVRR